MARVCVVGSVNSDLVFDVAALPGPGQTVLASALRTLPGGKGGNQAVAAARAGADVTWWPRSATTPRAGQLLDHLSANGVGTDGVVTLPVPSGTAVVVVGAGGENMIVVAPGANAHLTLDSQASARIPSPTPMWCCCSWRFPSRRPLVAARQAREAGRDGHPQRLPGRRRPGRAGRARGGGRRRRRQRDGGGGVAVAGAASGDHPRRPGREPTPGPDTRLEVAAPSVEAVDTTGAGDVFAGVLAAGWTADRHDALRRACAAGALATLVPGAGDCAPYDEAIEDALTGN